jgi:hypothetical protein
VPSHVYGSAAAATGSDTEHNMNSADRKPAIIRFLNFICFSFRIISAVLFTGYLSKIIMSYSAPFVNIHGGATIPDVTFFVIPTVFPVLICTQLQYIKHDALLTVP